MWTTNKFHTKVIVQCACFILTGWKKFHAPFISSCDSSSRIIYSALRFVTSQANCLKSSLRHSFVRFHERLIISWKLVCYGSKFINLAHALTPTFMQCCCWTVTSAEKWVTAEPQDSNAEYCSDFLSNFSTLALHFFVVHKLWITIHS